MIMDYVLPQQRTQCSNEELMAWYMYGYKRYLHKLNTKNLLRYRHTKIKRLVLNVLIILKDK